MQTQPRAVRRDIARRDNPEHSHRALPRASRRPATPLQQFRRRFAWLRLTLGALWLIDGLLQWQPGNFHNIAGSVEQIGQGQPAPIHAVIAWGGRLLTHAPTVANGSLATVEVLIGVLLLLGIRSREVLVASMLLAVPIWIFGEGMGQLFSGNATDVSAAPLYLLLALAIYLGQGWTSLNAVTAFRGRTNV